MPLANNPDGETKADPDGVKQRRREDEAGSIGKSRRGLGHFGAVRIAVENREQASEPHRRECGDAEPKGECQAEHDDGNADGDFGIENRDAGHPKRAAGSHHRGKGQGDEPEGAPAEDDGVNADRDHREEVVDAAERMQETVSKAARVAYPGMRKRRRKRENRGNNSQNKSYHWHPLSLAKASIGHERTRRAVVTSGDPRYITFITGQVLPWASVAERRMRSRLQGLRSAIMPNRPFDLQDSKLIEASREVIRASHKLLDETEPLVRRVQLPLDENSAIEAPMEARSEAERSRSSAER
jgi:hypothetical protein